MTMQKRLLITLTLFAALVIGEAHAQSGFTAANARERYQQRLAAAEKNKNDGIAKVTDAYAAEVKAAQDEVRRSFEPLIRAAAMWNKTEEVTALTHQIESIINPDGAIPATPGPAQGRDFIQLIGKWELDDSEGGFFKTVEFKSPKIVLFTRVFFSNSGKRLETEEWKATTKLDKIVIERTEQYMISTSFKQWYEITIPFSKDVLEMTRYSESPGRNSSESFHFKRKP